MEDSWEHIMDTMDTGDNRVGAHSEEDGFCDCEEHYGNRSPSPDQLELVDSYYVFDKYCRKIITRSKYPGILNEKMELKDVIKEHVLPFLPAKSLLRFRTVSKEWNQWITCPFFIHKQTNNFKDISGLFCQLPGDKPFFISLNKDAYGIPSPSLSFLPEPVTFRSSCNGLLCCQSFNGENDYYICNPATKEWKVLPKSDFYHGPDSSLALAFEPSVLNFASNFELVCAFSLTDQPVVCFEVYSSRSSSWRLAETVCSDLDALKLIGDGLFLKGVVFWETSAGAILAFDLREEQYGTLPLPPGSGPQGAMTEMYGELCYILPCNEDQNYTLEIYGDMNMILKQRISLNIPGRFNRFINVHEQLRALACVNDDVVIILQGRALIAYHVKAGEVEVLISNVSSDFGYVKYLPYVNSLVHVRTAFMHSLFSMDHRIPTA